MTNLWHDISPGTKESINVIIEINRGSKNKYEIDKEIGLITLDRVPQITEGCPFDYGSIPQTLSDDGDPLDVVVLTTFPLLPGILVRVRPIGLINMIDDGEPDSKLLTVPVRDSRFDDLLDIEDMNKHILNEIEQFFLTYKKLDGKEVTVGLADNKEKAEELFEKAIISYKEKFNK